MASHAWTTTEVVTTLSVLGVTALLVLYMSRKLRQTGEKEAPYVPPPKPVPCPRDFTTQELAEFNGQNGKAIYIGVKNVVFDVSCLKKGRDFYGPDGPYGCFAGKEASRALAMHVFSPEEMNRPDWNTLDKLYMEGLDEWFAKFKMQYDVVGQVVWPAASK